MRIETVRPSEIEDQIDEEFEEYQRLLVEILSTESISQAFISLRGKVILYGEHLDELNTCAMMLRHSLLHELREKNHLLRRELEGLWFN